MNRRLLHSHHPASQRRTAPALLAALGLLAWLALPLEADVIDDFSGPKKFILGGFNGDPEYNTLDGQFHLNLPTPRGYAAFAGMASTGCKTGLSWPKTGIRVKCTSWTRTWRPLPSP